MEEPSSVSPDDIMADFDPDEAMASSGPSTLEDFPPEVREDVEGLLWLGYLEDEFEFCGHNFVIRTLRGDEELLASLVSKDWIESLGQTRAWIWAQVAMAIAAIDGDDAFCPPTGPDRRTYARARFQYCTQRWFWPVAEHIFAKYVDLQRRQDEAFKRVEDLSARNLHTFTPFADSSTEAGDSDPEEEEPMEDIREYLDPPDSTDSNSDSSDSTSEKS